jgi:putative flippase GtrA
LPKVKGLFHQALRFGVVGLVNTCIGLAAIYALMFFGASTIAANAAGYAIGVGVSFGLNRVWTFQSTKKIVHALPRYIFTVGVCYLLNLAIVLASVHGFDCNRYAAQLFGIVAYSVCMFSAARWFVFAAERDLATEG